MFSLVFSLYSVFNCQLWVKREFHYVTQLLQISGFLCENQVLTPTFTGEFQYCQVSVHCLRKHWCFKGSQIPETRPLNPFSPCSFYSSFREKTWCYHSSTQNLPMFPCFWVKSDTIRMDPKDPDIWLCILWSVIVITPWKQFNALALASLPFSY